MERIPQKQIKIMKRILLFTSVLVLMVSIVRYLGYGFSIQLSPSMPKGIYWVIPARSIFRGDVVIFKPSNEIDNFLLRHHWIPQSGILIKKVYGVPGDFVCKKNHEVFINHQKIAYVFDEYAPNKKLPNIPFCGKLKKDEYLLMSTRVKKSFDGRYFGIINRHNIIGKADKL